MTVSCAPSLVSPSTLVGRQDERPGCCWGGRLSRESTSRECEVPRAADHVCCQRNRPDCARSTRSSARSRCRSTKVNSRAGAPFWSILTDTNDKSSADALGLNYSTKLSYAAVGKAIRTATLEKDATLTSVAGTVDVSPGRTVVPGDGVSP